MSGPVVEWNGIKASPLEAALARAVASITERLQEDARMRNILREALTRLRCGESEELVRARLIKEGIVL